MLFIVIVTMENIFSNLQKLIEGELDEKREKKMIDKAKKKARKEITKEKCLKEFPDSKIKRKACEKTGF